VFAAVAAEAARLLSSEATLMSRYDGDDTATIVGAWTGGLMRPSYPRSAPG